MSYNSYYWQKGTYDIFDINGNVIEDYDYNSDSSPDYKYTYKYEFDVNKNWIKK